MAATQEQLRLNVVMDCPGSSSSTQCGVRGEAPPRYIGKSIGVLGVVLTQTRIKPGAGIGPLALRGPRGKPKGGGGIFQSEPRKKTQVYQPGGVGVLRGELSERFIQCDQL